MAESTENPQTLEEWITERQIYWHDVVNELASSMKNLAMLPELMNKVYVCRQEAVDYYHSLMATFASKSREYKQLYATTYNNVKQNANIRYSTESAVNAQVDAVLRDSKYQIDIIENHIKYMSATIKNITDIVYGINTRVEIEKLTHSVKL